MKIAVVIPAYQPDKVLIELADELLKRGIPYIVIVDDGSFEDKKWIFDSLDSKEKCLVIHHSRNLGKGIALKTGIDAVLNSNLQLEGIVTADADGQHRPDDIIKTAEAFLLQPDALLLGCRSFSQADVPLRSKLGNRLTRFVFKLVSGIKISDTQTGLRAFSLENAARFLKIEGNRYEYEMNMLLTAAREGIAIKETEIETVYHNHNRSSHFKTFVDSFYVYRNFLRYAISGILSFLLDLTLYAVFSFFFRMAGFAEFILYATFISRILSSLFNYFCNKRFVFNNRDKGLLMLVKYYILCMIQMLLSAFMVRSIYGFIAIDTVIIKCFVDIMLACVSYQVQKWLIFRR